MGHNVYRLAADCANRVAVVAVVEEDRVVLVQRCELLGRARTSAVVVYALANGKVLVLAASDGAEGDGCNN